MPIPIFEVQFDKDANVFQPKQEADILRFLNTAPGNGTTDVVALSHGWNNDMDEARTLYRTFLARLEPLLPAAWVAGRAMRRWTPPPRCCRSWRTAPRPSASS
ncbi:MAG: hypothetical protein LAQ30_06750 [Acidobacteriia bacterium]|nr:hypothetical protein [Terriglobia bacterium]